MRKSLTWSLVLLATGLAIGVGCISTDDLIRNVASAYGVDGNLVDDFLDGGIDPSDYGVTEEQLSMLRNMFPSSISLDVEDVPASESSRQLAEGYSGMARGARDIVDMFQSASQNAFGILRTMGDGVSGLTTNTVEGTFDINGQTVAYKCDFSAFDFDGDGISDGSGDFFTEPVAFRVWTDKGEGFNPFICGLITTFPEDGSNSNLGAGTIVAAPFNGDESAPANLQIRVEWDRTDSAHKWNQAYVSGSVDEVEDVVLDIGEARVDVRGDGAPGAERTIRASADFAVHPADFETMQSSVHVDPGNPFFLLTAQSSGGVFPFGVQDVCISLEDFSELSGGECGAFDTQDMNLLDIPIGGENAFPADFPGTPTF